MSRVKLLATMVLITLSALQAFSPYRTWYSPFIAAFLIILLTALLQKSEPGDDL